MDLYLGIMSGTSLDGIDVAIARFDPKPELISFYSTDWPEGLRSRLLEFATIQRVEMDTLVQTHFILAEEYARATNAAIENAHLTISDIRAIGLHGQTVRHLPAPPHPATLQLGSGAALAAITGIDVVSDFRSADVAVGGQGAPLVPMFDHRFLRSDSIDRLIVNIGGIANVTWLPRNAREEEVIAFDSGPGNMLLDQIAKQYFDLPFDQNGERGRSGRIDEAVLNELLSHPYFKTAPPKSTGRELFSDHFLSAVNKKITNGELSPNDALATLAEFTARSITQSLDFVNATSNGVEIIVSGGGAFNGFLLKRISSNAPNANVRTSDVYGIPPKAKEAIAFAFFAKAFIESIPIHLPTTTGARRRVTLGSLSRGANLH